MRIGIFDSGVGGLSVAQAVEKELPQADILFVNDQQNVPYGTKDPAQLLKFVAPILDDMAAQGCEVIVVACNTVTTTLIESLRSRLAVPLIGMEPMVKPAAAATNSRIIAICATPTTLKSTRYAWLKKTYASGLRVLEPDCSDWSHMIESKRLDRQKIIHIVNEVCEQGADAIVLGCTHYHWIEDLIRDTANGRAIVLQPEVPVIAQLKRVLKLSV